MREFTDQLKTTPAGDREDLRQLRVSQQDVNDLFNIRLMDLTANVQSTINDEKKNYLDMLTSEKSLQKQLLDIATQRQQMETDYQTQRHALLGFSTRALSQAEQLAALDKQHAVDVANLNDQQTAAQDQLDTLERQKQVYVDEFGVVQDIAKFQLAVEDQINQKTKDRLDALLTFFSQTIPNAIQSGLGGEHTYQSPPFQTYHRSFRIFPNSIREGQFLVLLVTPFWPWYTVGKPSYRTDQTRCLLVVVPHRCSTCTGDVSVGSNMSKADAKQAFVDSWRAVLQGNSRKGLAFA